MARNMTIPKMFLTGLLPLVAVLETVGGASSQFPLMGSLFPEQHEIKFMCVGVICVGFTAPLSHSVDKLICVNGSKLQFSRFYESPEIGPRTEEETQSDAHWMISAGIVLSSFAVGAFGVWQANQWWHNLPLLFWHCVCYQGNSPI